MKRHGFATKLGCLLIALLLFGSLFVGCSDNADNKEREEKEKAGQVNVSNNDKKDNIDRPKESNGKLEPGWKKNASKPVKFDWYVDLTFAHPKWGSNPTSKYITEKTGVDLNIILNPGVGAEKMNTMVAADALPDLVSCGFWEGFVDNMIKSGQVYSLNELADKYDPYFYEISSDMVLNWYQRDDGKTYGYSFYSLDPNNVPEGIKYSSASSFLVRKDIYEAIGKPDMTTPEGFIKALEDAKKKFPEVEGAPLIPFAFTHHFDDFGNYSEVVLNEFLGLGKFENGEYFGRNTPEYVTWIKTFSNAFRKGLMSDSVLVDNQNQIKDKVAQGRYFALLGTYTDVINEIKSLYEKDPNKTYIAVNGPSGSKPPALRGVYGPGGWEMFFITKNCKDPERAIQFLTYLLSDEGQKDLYLGKEGVTYDMVDGKPVYKDKVLDMWYNDSGKLWSEYGSMNAYMAVLLKKTELLYEPSKKQPQKQIEEFSWGKTVVKPWMEGIEPTDASTEEGKVYNKLNNEWSTVLPKILTAESDEEVDKLLRDFYNFREKEGYEKFNVYIGNKIEENKQKMGLK